MYQHCIWQQTVEMKDTAMQKPVHDHFCKMNSFNLTRDCDIYSSDQLQ